MGARTRFNVILYGWNRGCGKIFQTHPDRPEAHPAFCAMGTGSAFQVYIGRDVALTTHSI